VKTASQIRREQKEFRKLAAELRELRGQVRTPSPLTFSKFYAELGIVPAVRVESNVIPFKKRASVRA
jgi:hypothetical protein